MSESPAKPTAVRTIEQEILPYAYPEMPWSDDLHGWSHAFGRETLHATPGNVTESVGSVNGHAGGQGAQPQVEAQQRTALDAQWLERLGEETRKAAEKGRQEGFAMGLARGREESSGASREERDRLLQQGAALAAAFAEERARYFHQAEEELVRLALAIAARVLRREAQMDPLLLTGAVRVALGQLAQATSVRVHVPEVDRPLWKEAFARLPNLAHRPEVIGEAEMELGDCRIETELGSADLSLWAQMKEIEHGFFDRVGARGVAGESGAEPLQPGYAQERPNASAASGVSARSASASGADVRPAPKSRHETPATSAASVAEQTAAGAVDESAMANAYYEREW